MTSPPEHDIARRVAARLEHEAGESVAQDVEQRLSAREHAAPDVYEPATLGLAGLVVSIAALSWNIYRDLKRDTPSRLPGWCRAISGLNWPTAPL